MLAESIDVHPQVEKRLELVKQVSHSTHKKLTACLQGQQGSDSDKRSKKLPLTSLAQCLMEGSAILGDDSLLGKMLKLCGEAEDKLAQELIHFELQVERDVIEPLFVLAEVEIPNIQKQRKHLAKLVLDMDSSRTRWQQSAKSSGLSSNLQPSGAKADALREEMEEAANRVEICRDQLSADMYNFVAKEIDYANYFQTLIEVQAEYHRKSLALLQNVLPQIKAQQEAWIEKPSFGKPLEEHLAVSGREIAFPIEACVTMLLECGMQEEGLFRVAPSASKLKKLKAALDCCVVDVQEYSADPHAIAGALKSYLRELPEPLMTFELYEEWIQASNIQDQDKRLQALWNALEKLPKASYNNLRQEEQGHIVENIEDIGSRLRTAFSAANSFNIILLVYEGDISPRLNKPASAHESSSRIALICEMLPLNERKCSSINPVVDEFTLLSEAITMESGEIGELSSWPTLQESPTTSAKQEKLSSWICTLAPIFFSTSIFNLISSHCRYLIKFLANLTEYQDANKMTPSNIAIVLGPNLLWPQTEGNITEMMATVSLQIVAIIEPLIQHADWFFPGDIEFNLTGNYGSPVHVNHNANYNSMPSPDMDHADHKHSDQTRRPLSVATDNMMLEFYKKDGVYLCVPPTSMGVRVMDTSWVARRGPSIVRKASSTPPAMQPPAPPCELAAPPQSPIPEQSLDISATPSPTPASFGFPPGAERASTDGVSSNWSDSCYIYPSPEDDKPPLYPHYSSFYPYPPRTSPCTRPEPPLPPYHWAGNNPTLPPPCSPSCSSSPSFQSFDINFLHLPKQISLTELHGPETNLSFVTTKTAFTLSKPNPPGTLPYSSSMSVSSPWVSCTCARDRGAGLTSTLKTKELSLVSGQKGSLACSHTTPGGGTAQLPPGPTAQLSTEQSPHTLRKVSKKLTPLPAKGPYGQSGGMSDPSTGQPSPASLSPTPPSTPSPYGLSYPPGYSLSSGPLSPAAAPSLSSPPSLTSTLTKSRPTPKPRQRPTLPPPQPPTSNASGSSPQSTEHTILDDMSPGESMSTGNQIVKVGHRLVVWETAGITSRDQVVQGRACPGYALKVSHSSPLLVIGLPFCLCLVTDLAHLDIPSIHVEVDATLHLDPSGQVQRHPVPGKVSSEEDSESTAL
ncbi:Rho GTPase-activating protein 44, partial [Ophiophagus hannah]